MIYLFNHEVSRNKMKYNTLWTLGAIKKYLKEHFHNGIDCPACGQLVKMYRRKLNSGMSYFLINLYKLNKKDSEGFYHASEILGKSFSMDYAILRHWKLIEENVNQDKSKRNSGFWRITEKGRSYVLGEINVPSHVLLYNNKLVGFSDTEINIKESLTDKFNYQELIS